MITKGEVIMTWDEYKEEVKEKDPATGLMIAEAEIEAHVISAIYARRNELGISQRELAEQCEIPQSSIARIEGNKTMPRLDTIAKIYARLGLTLTVRAIPIKA